jgi:hypothetical protein
MNVNINIFHTQKNGNSEDEYEDAYQPAINGEYEAHKFFAAMADGASEGFLSGQWADILVREYCNDQSHKSNLTNFVEETEAKWDEFLEAYIKKRGEDNRPIQWYEEPGLENGAFSTLIGLSIFDGLYDGERTWTATAIGDTCLFQIRQTELICCFPIQNAESFNSWPALISSNPIHNINLIEKSKSIEGSWEDNDQFFIMSDAISAWFLREHENNHQPSLWMQELLMASNDEFVDWIAELREKNEIRNDDVTFMSLTLSES